MHLFIKDNYLNLDDVLVVSTIEDAGSHGGKFFSITYKNGKAFDFFYSRSNQKDVYTSTGHFHFGTDCFFYNAHKEILNKLTDNTKSIIKNLSDEQRMEIFSDYCRHCGSTDPKCQCWNDE